MTGPRTIRRALALCVLPMLAVGLTACLDLSGTGGGGGLLGQLGQPQPGSPQTPGSAPGAGVLPFPVEQWARRGGDDGKGGDGRTALHEAAKGGHERRAKELLDDGAKVDPRDDEGRTPLHLAAREGHMDVVKVLLKEGASAWKEDKKGKRPSRLALDKGHKDVYRYLRSIERRRR